MSRRLVPRRNGPLVVAALRAAAVALAVVGGLAGCASGGTTSGSNGPGGSAPTAAPEEQADVAAALTLLDGVPVENEHRGGYDRDRFEHWIDADGDGCDTRREVLIRDSVTPVQVGDGCWLTGGEWVSPYDGAVLTSVGEVTVDHVVALKEAWDSGAWAWDDARRRDFANDLSDPRTLRATSAQVNEDKGADDPSNWLPPRRSDWCRYVSDWVHIKARWGLSMDRSEAGRVRNVLQQCS